MPTNHDDLARPGWRHVFLRDLVLEASIGVHAHEQRAPQRVRINIDLAVADEGEPERAAGREDLAGVVDYQAAARAVRAIVRQGHIRLAETLAERIATACLALDQRVYVVRVMVEKLEVFADAVSAGVAIERSRNQALAPNP